MVTYEFGVMTNKWKLEAEDMIIAYITMAMFIGKDILENNPDFKPNKVRECFKTIQEVSVNSSQE